MNIFLPAEIGYKLNSFTLNSRRQHSFCHRSSLPFYIKPVFWNKFKVNCYYCLIQFCAITCMTDTVRCIYTVTKRDTLFCLFIYLFIFVFVLCFLQGYCDWKFPASWEKPSIINLNVIPAPFGRRCAGTKQRATLHWNQVCTSTVVKICLLPSPRGVSTGRLIWHSVPGNNESWPSTCKKPLLGKIDLE